jgi:4-hydroxy-2-oxoheptanedioate aldolase
MSAPVSSLRRLLGDRRLVGTFVKLAALESIEIAAAELDFAVVDLEHSQLSEADALRLVNHARALGLPAVVRIPAVDRGLVNRLLEAGAAGLQLSSVRRSAEVRALRDAALYAPAGRRSISLAHPVARFGATPLDEYVRGLEPPLLVAQLETVETDDALDEVVRAGVDVVFLGVTDLLVDAGLDRERSHTRAEEIAASVQGAGVHLGGFGTDERYRYAVVSSDVALLREAVARVR